MSADGEYHLNEDVQLTKDRKIAARGLTPNHIGSKVAGPDGSAGILREYLHREGDTVIKAEASDGLTGWAKAYAHLDVIVVTD